MNGFSERESKIDKLLRVELQRQISAKVVRVCARAREVAKAVLPYRASMNDIRDKREGQ